MGREFRRAEPIDAATEARGNEQGITAVIKNGKREAVDGDLGTIVRVAANLEGGMAASRRDAEGKGRRRLEGRAEWRVTLDTERCRSHGLRRGRTGEENDQAR